MEAQRVTILPQLKVSEHVSEGANITWFLGTPAATWSWSPGNHQGKMVEQDKKVVHQDIIHVLLPKIIHLFVGSHSIIEEVAIPAVIDFIHLMG